MSRRRVAPSLTPTAVFHTFSDPDYRLPRQSDVLRGLLSHYRHLSIRDERNRARLGCSSRATSATDGVRPRCAIFTTDETRPARRGGRRPQQRLLAAALRLRPQHRRQGTAPRRPALHGGRRRPARVHGHARRLRAGRVPARVGARPERTGLRVAARPARRESGDRRPSEAWRHGRAGAGARRRRDGPACRAVPGHTQGQGSKSAGSDGLASRLRDGAWACWRRRRTGAADSVRTSPAWSWRARRRRRRWHQPGGGAPEGAHRAPASHGERAPFSPRAAGCCSPRGWRLLMASSRPAFPSSGTSTRLAVLVYASLSLVTGALRTATRSRFAAEVIPSIKESRAEASVDRAFELFVAGQIAARCLSSARPPPASLQNAPSMTPIQTRRGSSSALDRRIQGYDEPRGRRSRSADGRLRRRPGVESVTLARMIARRRELSSSTARGTSRPTAAAASRTTRTSSAATTSRRSASRSWRATTSGRRTCARRRASPSSTSRWPAGSGRTSRPSAAASSSARSPKASPSRSSAWRATASTARSRRPSALPLPRGRAGLQRLPACTSARAPPSGRPTRSPPGAARRPRSTPTCRCST